MRPVTVNGNNQQVGQQAVEKAASAASRVPSGRAAGINQGPTRSGGSCGSFKRGRANRSRSWIARPTLGVEEAQKTEGWQAEFLNQLPAKSRS